MLSVYGPPEEVQMLQYPLSTSHIPVMPQAVLWVAQKCPFQKEMGNLIGCSLC